VTLFLSEIVPKAGLSCVSGGLTPTARAVSIRSRSNARDVSSPISPPRRPTVFVEPRRVRIHLKLHDLIVGLLVFVGLAVGAMNVQGSEVSASSHSSPDAADEGHRCKCRSCRSADSCCCAPPKRTGATKRPSASPPTTDQVQSGAGPCMNAAPCGEGTGLPTSASGLTMNKAISLFDSVPALARSTGQSHFAPTESLDSAILASRLDDPPEESLVTIP